MTGIEEAHHVVILMSRLKKRGEIFRTQDLQRQESRDSIGHAKTYSESRDCKFKNE